MTGAGPLPGSQAVGKDTRSPVLRSLHSSGDTTGSKQVRRRAAPGAEGAPENTAQGGGLWSVGVTLFRPRL